MAPTTCWHEPSPQKLRSRPDLEKKKKIVFTPFSNAEIFSVAAKPKAHTPSRM